MRAGAVGRGKLFARLAVGRGGNEGCAMKWARFRHDGVESYGVLDGIGTLRNTCAPPA